MQTRKNWEVFDPGRSKGARACCWSGFLIGSIGLLAQWGDRVGRKIKWKGGKKTPEGLQIQTGNRWVGLNWMQCGTFENETDWFTILGDIWREGEGRCFWRMFFHIPGIYNSRWRGQVLLPLSGDWLKLCDIRGMFQMCLCFSVFLPVPQCSIHFCKFHLTFKYF